MGFEVLGMRGARFVVVFKSPDQMGISGSFFFEVFAVPAINPTEPIPAIAPPIKFLLLTKFSCFCGGWGALPFLDLSFLSDIIVLLAKICVHLLFLMAEVTKAFTRL
ncbi:hypothetical protein ES703_41491 [subsurface metagenome]